MDINKVVYRKRMNDEAEKLREKISHETVKLNKLKVAQESAYWHLNEKLKQAENNHEKLQQNMVGLQMQYEAISGQYQEELRFRPDTLNKLSSTHKICDVLQDFIERLKNTLMKCKEDHVVLHDAYENSGRVVRDIQSKHLTEREQSHSHIEGLKEKIKIIEESKDQLVEVFTAAKQRADAEIVDLGTKLTSAEENRNELIAAQNELNKKLKLCQTEIEKTEKMIANLQTEVKMNVQDLQNQVHQVFEEKDKQIKELSAENATLKNGLQNQEEITRSLCEQKSILKEKIAVKEDECLALKNNAHDLKKQVEEKTGENQSLQNIVTMINEEHQKLLQEIENVNKVLNNTEQAIQNLKEEISTKKDENKDLSAIRNSVTTQSDERAIEIEKLNSSKALLEDKLADLETTFKTLRDVADAEIKELKDKVEVKDNEIDSKATTINQLMSDLKTSTDIRYELEETIGNLKNEIDNHWKAAKFEECTMASKIGQLETDVKNKDNDLLLQTSMIKEMTTEKERLHGKTLNMQNKLDNIQKEIIRPAPSTAENMQPELDEDAVMFSPPHKELFQVQEQSQRPSGLLPSLATRRPSPQPLRVTDELLTVYNFLSDNSMEITDHKIIPVVKNSSATRRFAAVARDAAGERHSLTPRPALGASGGLIRKKTNYSQFQSQERGELSKNKRHRK